MRFIERILGKVDHRIIYLICRICRYTIADTAGNASLRTAVHEILTFLVDNVLLLLAHRTTYIVSLSHRISCKVSDYPHDLFLIYDTAVCRIQYRFKLRTAICDLVRIVLALDILRNEIHRSRSVK